MKKIKLIRQRHENGCSIACISMVTGKTYDEIDADFSTDFNQNGLMLDKTIEYLGAHNYSLIHKYITQYGHKDFGKDEMLNPFAPKHIVRVQPKADSDYGHVMVMDADGQLFCPDGQTDEEARNSYIVTDVIGIWGDNDLRKKKKQ